MTSHRCTLESASKIAAQLGPYIPQRGVVATPVVRQVSVFTPEGRKTIPAYFSVDGSALRLQCPYTGEWFEFALATFNFRRLTRVAHPYALGYRVTSWPIAVVAEGGGFRHGGGGRRHMGALPMPSSGVTQSTIGGVAGGALIGALIGWVAEAPFAGAIIGAGLGGFGGYVAGKSAETTSA